ncbi:MULTISPECIES: hypothetical protein [unclassified Leisingera]|uniref:hypothetical protein n=1 Tax=unclassified Leisingera TaxID=2614906 RepID=UPI0002F8318F|nr:MULTISPECIES: hypothetical protein [unclassified Leisingera]KIC16474.1 hypothetical protein RA21_12600 [Leisingera sp. ANG-DT]KIC24631.1 hypothetical protein RA23_08730 [Leisingera sp. ANG-S3]KIC28587.1 hypothetical protein RA24_11825 [Leisingera sp. ANG-M6]KIC31714.1 hypothetical protein RA25_16585 [Leisingera sp. ANG-S5]KIC55513.1 hypothetical protein RA22_01880 [Leisingera sp. ANG-S]
MRDFFISAFEKLVGLIVILMVVGVLGGAAAIYSDPFKGGTLPALLVLLGGLLYVIMLGGMLYLFLGIYHNTKRTAEAVDRQARS